MKPYAAEVLEECLDATFYSTFAFSEFNQFLDCQNPLLDTSTLCYERDDFCQHLKYPLTELLKRRQALLDQQPRVTVRGCYPHSAGKDATNFLRIWNDEVPQNGRSSSLMSIV